ncbi:hypothetical protein [Niveispirillum cyanobacteriorum]|uniref:Uncharacterized protein n=1 Tax=Niveispirillum cyanobacteriorum TaxID=1612173 RepID=A0A2K9NDQ3_9PROT|nr:hypothetical protein [Niveispirillum cyanobacteriorum]AUN31263.1 hypothetical protein C0V82_14225 [Niveispirillum cyanobacteriorum]GGE72817.1 hypothetical protein GCM10011317_32580 [Niveispirillum cyanobacteriorum]
MDWGEIKLGDLSGWAQFAGGIGSIVAAWMIARSQQKAVERAQEAERQIKAIAIASAVSREMEEFALQLPKLEWVIGVLKSLGSGGSRDINYGQLRIEGLVVLSSLRPELYVLGPEVAAAALLLLTEKAALEQWISDLPKGGRGQAIMQKSNLKALIDYHSRMAEYLSVAQQGMGVILDEGARFVPRFGKRRSLRDVIARRH